MRLEDLEHCGRKRELDGEERVGRRLEDLRLELGHDAEASQVAAPEGPEEIGVSGGRGGDDGASTRSSAGRRG